MTSIEYLSLSKPRRATYKFVNFFTSIPKGICRFFLKLPNKIGKLVKKIINPIRILSKAFIRGDFKTKLSFAVMGFGQIFNHQLLRGFFNLIFEVSAILFLIFIGVPQLAKLPTFGTIASIQETIPIPPFSTSIFVDDSFLILLNSIISILVIICFIFLWYNSIKEAFALQNLKSIGKVNTDKETIKSMVNENYHKVLLGFPTAGIMVFTIVPMIFMILIAFTNFNSDHMNPKELFDWVGTGNFDRLLGLTGQGGKQFVGVFLQILAWTLIWAFFATFTNYFLGMIVAIMINKKGIKLKKIWRTILITTIAVPQFVSLLLLSKVLDQNLGVLNHVLTSLGLISENIPFLSDGLIAKVSIIVVNMWIGIPYTMLMCTGILMNIPEDLYESAKIDGASPYKMYMKITLPYMLFVTGPYLISSFVGNINNFNVIYLLSQGGPTFTQVNGEIVNTRLFGAGQTDLLITWLYKMAMGEVFKDYGVASVIGIVVFIIVASLSLIFYNKSNAIKNEEDYQ